MRGAGAFKMPRQIQLGEGLLPSMGSAMDGASHDCYATFNRWNDERNVNVNRNDNDWNDNWWFAGLRNSLHFSPALVGEFCFWSCPCQPPSIFPTSSSGTESAMYRLSRRDFVSHRIKSRTLSVSSFRIARRTHGIFSLRGRNAAPETASIISIKRASTLAPTV